MSTKQAVKHKPSNAGNKKKKGAKGRKKANYTAIICSAVLVVMAAAAIGGYMGGKSYYNGKFLANTKINGVSVGSKNYDDACSEVVKKTMPSELTIAGLDGKKTIIKTADFDYRSNADEEIRKIFDGIDHSAWFTGLIDGAEYNFEEKFTYSKNKLTQLLKAADWGDTPSADAFLKENNGKYEIVKEVQGNKIEDMDKLVSAVTAQVDKGNFNIALSLETGCYKTPSVLADSLSVKCDNLNKIMNLSIGYDFTYTVEKLTGKRLVNLLNVAEDGTYTVDRDKCMQYVDNIAKKYDTYDTERKFHATLQGNITVPTSSDAKYGWWIDKDKTCEQLAELLEQGKSVEKIEPIYYETGGYEFTGVKSARTKNDDIGKTYVEIDLTAQHLWVYKKGKKVYECDIVSGQTTSEARTTLPGVYKVWFKARNYRMKDTNSEGESWDTTCEYWNRVAIVGIGLHDSAWRGTAFGGTIYQYNGSHGCINMPPEGAQYIYEKVAMGTPVVMYY